jgi:hypothetical protein
MTFARRAVATILAAAVVAACASASPYQRTTTAWTRKAKLRTTYQEALQLAAIYKSAEWRAAHAAKQADARGLSGTARDQLLASASAAATGPIEIELLVTTWDRRENDLDRGDNATWRVRLIDDRGAELAPLEVVKDKRPQLAVRADYIALGDFAVAYIARFPASAQLATIRLRVSSSRGGVEVSWPR